MADCTQICRIRSFILSFFAFFLLFTAISPVFGGGGRDAALSKADALIKVKEYEEAILILTNFSRNNPDRFDKAQDRLRKIYKLRDEFNRTADELILTLLNEPENNEKILALSRKLYSLEKADSPLLVNFVSRTREISEFNVTRTNLRSILEKGRELLDKNDGAAAIQTYGSGMYFMRDDFFAGGYGEAIENEVLRETERVNSILASFPQVNSQIISLALELTRAISTGDMLRINQAITRLPPGIDRLTELKNDLYDAANSFDRILTRLQANNPELLDRNHLSFLLVIISGRSGEAVQEGMLGAFDASWRASIGSSLDALTLYLERANTSALASFNAKDYNSVLTALNTMENYYNLSGQFFERHRQLFRSSGISSAYSQTITFSGNTFLRLDARQFLELKALNESNNSLMRASDTAMRYNIDTMSLSRWQQGSITAAAAISAEKQTRNSINAAQRETANIILRLNQFNAESDAYYKITHISNTVKSIDALRAGFQKDELQSVYRYYTIAHNSLKSNLNTRKEELERGRNFLNGERREYESGVTIYYYPTEALEVLTRTLNAVSADLADGNSILAEYRNERQTISADTELSAIHANYQAAVNETAELRNQALALAETARSRSTQAEAFKQEADRLYREAQTAYQRQNFEAARERVTQASARINNSLEIQASASLRSTWDAQLLNLGESISRAENELIIIEVRNLVNSARSAYFAGSFQQAEDNLLRARSRWRVTNSEENDEVIYWLGIIRTALSARSGRVIPATAPLFTEMSQLLSHAQRSYEEGVRHINAGRRAQGLAKFEEARRMTREVRLMFPVNHEAGILELRIEQFTDPAAFNASFEQRLRTAVSGTRLRSLESYADLQNLAEINPRYPNIRAILTQAEIDMGFRPPPPNPANIERSRELTASVNRIIEGNVSTLFGTALVQIDEAITLNPENSEATQAKDRLLSRMSVPGTIVLSREDEETYQRAMRELQAGNNLIARALVERLMENPRNRNITKLVELQRRLQIL